MIRMSLNIKSQGTKELSFSPNWTDDSKTLRSETLHIADYQYKKHFQLAFLDMNLRLEDDDDSHTNHSLYLF